MRRPSIFLLVAFAVLLVASAFDTLQCCTDTGTCFNPPPPAGTPTATTGGILRSWHSTAGVLGTFTNWCTAPPDPCLPPDHHDVAGEHAVDIGAPAGTTEVTYWDLGVGVYVTNIKRAELAWQWSCTGSTGGSAAIITLYGVDNTAPTGERRIAYTAYRHITQGFSGVTVRPGELLGTVAANASTNPACWTAPHLHQGVGGLDPSVTFLHDTSGYKYPNCVPWLGDPYPGTGWSVGAPYCYDIHWNG